MHGYQDLLLGNSSESGLEFLNGVQNEEASRHL